MEWKYALFFIIGLCGIFLTAAILLRPVKWLVRFTTYVVVGTVLLLLLNVILKQMGMHIAINPATIFTVGVLQIPGALLLIVLSYFFV